MRSPFHYTKSQRGAEFFGMPDRWYWSCVLRFNSRDLPENPPADYRFDLSSSLSRALPMIYLMTITFRAGFEEIDRDEEHLRPYRMATTERRQGGICEFERHIEDIGFTLDKDTLQSSGLSQREICATVWILMRSDGSYRLCIYVLRQMDDGYERFASGTISSEKFYSVINCDGSDARWEYI